MAGFPRRCRREKRTRLLFDVFGGIRCQHRLRIALRLFVGFQLAIEAGELQPHMRLVRREDQHPLQCRNRTLPVAGGRRFLDESKGLIEAAGIAKRRLKRRFV